MFIVQSTLYIGNGMMWAVSGDAVAALLLSGADETAAAVETATELAEVVMVPSFSVGDRVLSRACSSRTSGVC
jgi:hypothetical protein